MADQTVTLRITANTQGLVTGVEMAKRETRSLGEEGQAAGRNLGGGIAAARAEIERTGSLINQVKGFVGGLAAAFVSVQTVRAVAQMADEWSDLTSLVRVNIGAHEDASAVMGRLSQVARTTYSGLQDTAQSFAANASTLSALGKTTQEQLDYTTALNNALVISGAKGEQFTQVQNALSKAMATGTLRGEDFNTVMARGSMVADALAEELGTNVLELRKMAADGKITGDVIFTALVRRMGELEAKAETMPATMADAMVVMRNSLLSLVGYADDASGATGGISEAIIELADVLSRPEVKEGFAGIAIGAVNAATEVAKLFGEVMSLADFAGRLVGMKVTGWVDTDDLELQQWRVAELAESIRRLEATRGTVTGRAMEFFGSDISGRIAEMEKEKQALLKNMGEVSAQRLVLNQQLRDAEAAAKAAAEAAGKQRTAELDAAKAAAMSAAESEEAKRKAVAEAKKLEQQRARLIEQAGRYLASLEKEIATFGMTEDAVRRYELAHTEGLTPAQREQAEAALDQIEANRQLKDVWDEATRAAESLVRGNDDLRERIAQQEDVLRGLTPAQVALNAANREAAVLEAQLALGKEGLTDAMREELQARLDLIQAYASNEAAIDAQRELADQASETGRMMQDEIRSFAQAAAEGTERVGDYFSNLWRRIKASLIQSGLTSLLGGLFGAMGGAGGGMMSMFGGSGGGAGSILSSIFSGSGMTAAGQSFGNGLVTAAPWLAAAGGAMYGYRNSGIGAAVGYGVGGYAVGTVAAYGLAGAAGAAGMGGAAMGAGAAGGAMMGAAAVPVIGWIIAAIAALDMITGGKVFGTKYRAESSSQTLGIGADGGYAAAERTDVRQRSLFRGRKWNTYAIDAGDDARASADALYSSIFDAMTSAARSLAIDVPPVIDAAIRTVTEYDKKGRITGLKIFTDALGRTWSEAISDPEDEAEIQAAAARAASRIQSEAIIATIDAALGTTVTQAVSDAITNPIIGGIDDALERLDRGWDQRMLDGDFLGIGGGPGRPGNAGGGTIGEASAIAERWRHDAELLAEGAQFLLLAASDIRRGSGLLADEGGLTAITALIEDLAASGETLTDTYVRVASSAALLDQALALSGVAIDGTREHIVRLATAITDAAGGLEAAQALWQSYFSNFYSAAELAQYNATQLRAAGDAAFAGAGLDIADYLDVGGMERFRAAFEAAMPTMSAEDIAAWLRAADALAAVTASARQIDAALDANAWQLHLDGLEENARAVAELARYYDDMQASLLANAASAEQLATLEDQRALAMGRLLATQAEQAAREQAEAEAARNAALGEYVDFITSVWRETQQLSAYQSAMMDADSWRTSAIATANEHARAAGLAAASEQALALIELRASQMRAVALARLREETQSLVDQLYGAGGDDIGTAFTTGLDSASNAAADYWDQQRRAATTLQDYLDSMLLGDVSALSAAEKLEEAWSQLTAAAAAGDADTATRLADTYLRLVRGHEASGDDWNAEFWRVRELLQGMLDNIGPIPDVASGGSSSAGGGYITAAGAEQVAAKNRLELAAQLSVHLADLAGAVNMTVYELMADMGVDLRTLAADLGISLQTITGETVLALVNMSDLLGSNITALTGAMGLQLTDLGNGIRELAEQTGVNLDALTAGSVVALAGLANQLGLDLAALAGSVGVDLGSLADAQSLLNQALAAQIDQLPDGTGDALRPFLEAIVAATEEADANAAIGTMAGFINSLAPDIRNALAPYFADVFPASALSDLDYLTSIDTSTAAMASAMDTVTVLLDRIAANAAAANNAANIPSYAVGTWNVPQTGPAILHQGEMVLPVPMAQAWRNGVVGGGREDNTAVVAELRRLADKLDRIERAQDRGARQVSGAVAATGEKSDRALDGAIQRMSASLPRGVTR